MKQIYAVVDLRAEEIVGGLMLSRHDAPMIRIFTDGINDPQTTLNKHPKDFALVCLGEAQDEGKDIEVSGYPKPRTVLTGEAVVAVQAPEDAK